VTQQLNKESVFFRFSFKQIMIFCSLIILNNIWHVFHPISEGSRRNEIISWIPWGAALFGLLFIVVGFLKNVAKEERFALGFLGLGIFIQEIARSFGKLNTILLMLVVFLETLSILMFWLACKKYQLKQRLRRRFM
jgi:hypothetical protein